MAEKKSIYPHLVIKNNEHPNKLLSFPILGILIKIILLIPALLFLILFGFVYFFVWCVTPFVILFTGKYWDAAYEIVVGLITYYTKIKLYYLGLTDKYPGFNLDANGLFELQIEKPQHPSRLLAFPLVGFFVRTIIMIPYSIYQSVLSNGSIAAMVVSWFAILFKGKYPESLYEFERDSIRVSISEITYMSYLSDDYPSFAISMKHKNVKIALIIAGAIITLWNTQRNDENHHNYPQQHETMYNNNNMKASPTYAPPESGS